MDGSVLVSEKAIHFFAVASLNNVNTHLGRLGLHNGVEFLLELEHVELDIHHALSPEIRVAVWCLGGVVGDDGLVSRDSCGRDRRCGRRDRDTS